MKERFKFIPEPLKKLLRETFFYKKWTLYKVSELPPAEMEEFLNQAPPVLIEGFKDKIPKIGIIKTQITGFDLDIVDPKASWLRYERFCINNNIPYEFYDITRSDWIEEAKRFDIIVCHILSTPSFKEMMESKIYILENYLGIFCFPSYHEIWQYEEKTRAYFLYKLFDIPVIPTVLTHNKMEALKLIENTDYPFITKTAIGSGSSGVKKIDSRKNARKIINKIFSTKGRESQFPDKPQKNYFYLQKFIDDATFDLRIMLIGNMAFGYYRYPNKGDFRASGAGNTVKKAIPEDALKLAVEIRNKLKSRQIGIDLLYSDKEKQYFVIETSLFNQVDTPMQLVIDGIPGYYDVSDLNNIRFKEGKFWIQELTMKELVDQWVDKKSENL